MSKTDPTPEPTDELTRLGPDAPIALELCVARFRLSLGELSSLAIGQVLDTGQPIGARATLRAGGRAVAEGELVEVEGCVGLRILSLG